MGARSRTIRTHKLARSNANYGLRAQLKLHNVCALKPLSLTGLYHSLCGALLLRLDLEQRLVQLQLHLICIPRQSNLFASCCLHISIY